MTTSSYHQPVLLQECIEGLNIQKQGVYVDVTFGGGGHSKSILSALGDNGRLIAFDQDPDAEANVPDDTRIQFIAQNFSYMKNYLRLYNVDGVDGILADLGVSSHQLNEASRGFSFRFDADLDMRMNTRSGESAAELLNRVSETELKLILKNYGEVTNASKIAKAIINARTQEPIITTNTLRKIASAFIPARFESKEMAKIFQALRIVVNNEMDVLKSFLTQSSEVLNSNGRLVVISYHSLEDRLVKDYMRSGNFEGIIEKDFYGNTLCPFEIKTRKPLVPTDKEIESNPRARSAKLRIAIKK
jgi:16S rRNA (cytosine1402-N4)-methyltransferase